MSFNIIPNKFPLNGLPRNENKPDKIILHHADSKECTIDDIQSWHLKRGFSMVGYHYFIRKDGSIYEGRPEDVRGSHCIEQNYNSIGICVEGKYEEEEMPFAQVEAVCNLIKYIFLRRGKMEIGKHSKYYATSCPGANYPFDYIVVNVSRETIEKPKNTGGYEMRKYVNGNTPEIIYQDSKCTKEIGFLNPHETCDCYGEIEGVALLVYKIDGTENRKTGFAKWLGGIQK